MTKRQLRSTRPVLGAQPTGPALPTAGTYADLAAGGQLRTAAIDQIVPNPEQPRRTFDPETLASLADSIRELGVLQPPLVRDAGDGTYELIAGERRWRAAGLAGLTRLQVIVRGPTDAALAALAENLQREDLDPVDEASAYAAILAHTDLTIAALAKRLGKSRPEISNTLRILDLPPDVLALLRHRKLTKGHARVLLAEPDTERRNTLAGQAADGSWTVRDLEQQRSMPTATRAPSTPVRDRQAPGLAAEADALSRALGHTVRVRPGGAGIKVSFVVAAEADLIALRRRLT